MQLEDIQKGAKIRGILADQSCEIIDIRWFGDVVQATYVDEAGRTDRTLIYRHMEPQLETVEAGTIWSFTGNGDDLKLALEALRIQYAYLFDSRLAVHCSNVMPLPHQITAVYEEMLQRQPLRFLLADDPGAGKTIMTGLLIKELIARGDVQRCLIVSPGVLVEQWQDELSSKFDLGFDLLTNEQMENARTGNWFGEHHLVICRLDKIARSEDLQEKLKQTDWDLIVVDEAHKMSATYFGGEAKYTKRYQLGRMLSSLTRHFLLLTATPHNGKEVDFQLFLALLDGDRFEGRYQQGVHQSDPSDLMRRLVKERLLTMEGRPLFPERRAYTVAYDLSPLEFELYGEVTKYVQTEFNRAFSVSKEKGNNVGFALTSLQRRLASSPEAIFRSLNRRKDRLTRMLHDAQAIGFAEATRQQDQPAAQDLDYEDLIDLEAAEQEQIEQELTERSSAAQTITELKAEIETLQRLEILADRVRRSGQDRKWDESSRLLQNAAEMFDEFGSRRKIVVFSEHRDTINYLEDRIGNLLGDRNAVVTIHGAMTREERRTAQERFKEDKDVLVLVATDAAGEGVNLQRAHLMINYDLPWNPNRLEQRFGRIHRIGQKEVCHLWNLVANDTREGDVFKLLLRKLEDERTALGGQVFDVLGELLFGDQPLHRLLLEAIRYGDQPEVKARLLQKVEDALDTEHLRELLEKRALTADSLDLSEVKRVREDLERADAMRLQPHYIESFFLEAFPKLGGSIHRREKKRYEITNVPAPIRRRDREIGRGASVVNRYERVAFEKGEIEGRPVATLVAPGHPLLDATLSLIAEHHRSLLKQGAIYVDSQDEGDTPRLLFALEHEIKDGRPAAGGGTRTASKQFQFVEIDRDGVIHPAGPAPYLDYRAPSAEESELLKAILDEPWLKQDLESVAIGHAVQYLVPDHLGEIREQRAERVDKARLEVHRRLTTEITIWDNKYLELRTKEDRDGSPHLNSEKARQRRDELQRRMEDRMIELDQEKQVTASPPRLLGGALVIPMGAFRRRSQLATGPQNQSSDHRITEWAAMDAVMAFERGLGFEPRDVSGERVGYDIESRTGDGRLRFIEVKGRVTGASSFTVTRNEILRALNKPEDYILALVEVYGDRREIVYVQQPFGREPDWHQVSADFHWNQMRARGDHMTHGDLSPIEEAQAGGSE